MVVPMMIAFTYLPAFVTASLQGMPGVWKSPHRLMLCWLIFMQALYPGRKSNHHPWFFGIRCVWLIAAWDGYRLPGGFRLLVPTRHGGYQNENTLLRQMGDEFLPPRWATRVIVCGDAA
jgi:hypothetical protein